MEISELEAEFQALKPELSFVDEQMARRCCMLALQALEQDCYGVGAVLLDADGAILVEGANQVFADEGFHSGAHAEMRALDQFEAEYSDFGDRSQLSLIVSLEPCPMCFTRIIAAGIGSVRYIAHDRDGGMVHLQRHLPAAWKNLASLGDFGVASVSSPLREFAAKLAKIALSDKRKRLISQIRG